MTQQFYDVNCFRGAPMGRTNYCNNPEAEVEVFLVNMVDGDYDDGGAYWGGSPSIPLYCARDEDRTVQVFYRATSIEAARRAVLHDYPQLRIKEAQHG